MSQNKKSINTHESTQAIDPNTSESITESLRIKELEKENSKLRDLIHELKTTNQELIEQNKSNERLDIENNTIRSSISDLQTELSSRNEVLEQVLEHTMAGYWDWHVGDHYEFLSPNFKKMFGYEDHEMENKPESWQSIMHPDDLLEVIKSFDEHVISKGNIPHEGQARYFHKNGSIVWVYYKGKIIEWDEKGKPLRMVGSHVDITPLKTYAQELERINHELDQFAYIASHDLQEPLRNVTNYINLIIEDHSAELSETPSSYLNFINGSVERMKKLIKGFLKFSRIGRELKPQLLDCNEVLTEVLQDLKLKIEETKAQIVITHELPKLLGLKTELRQLFQNLIGNAIKFRSTHRDLIIKITSESIEEGWQFSVADNGVGMEKVDPEKLFQIFQRMHQNKDFVGEGIGLAICKKVVELHGGQIWADSTLGEGSTFHFTIPGSH